MTGMTPQEAIAYLRPIMESASLPNYQAALSTALVALEVLADSSNSDWPIDDLLHALETTAADNEPLTLEELREMDGEPPVWVVGANDEDVNGNGYAVVHIWHEEFAQVSWPGDADEPEPLIENYGKTWLAYRRRPEAGR